MRLRYLFPLLACFCVLAGPLRVSLPPFLGSLPVVVAQKLGLFSERGLEVQLVPLPSQRDRIFAFQAGQIEAMVTDLVSAIRLVAAQPKEAAIAAALFVPPQDGSHLAFITPANYSRLYTLAEFVEAAKTQRIKIAVPRQSDLEFMADQLFSQLGFLFPSELYVGQDNLLINATWTLFGMTAAAVLPQPYVDFLLHYQFEGKPELLVLADFADLPVPPDVLVVRRSLSPQTVKDFLSVISEAVVKIRAMTKGELVALAMPLALELFFPGLNPEAASPEDRARIEAAVDALGIPSFTGPSPLDSEIFELVSAWARRKGYLVRPISYTEAIWPSQ